MLVTFVNRDSEHISLVFTALADGSKSVVGPFAPGAEAARTFNVGGVGDIYAPMVEVVSQAGWAVEVKRDATAAEFARVSEVRSGGGVSGVAMLNAPDGSAVLTGVNGTWGANAIKIEVAAAPYTSPATGPGSDPAPVPPPVCDPPEARFPVDLDGDGKADFDVEIQKRPRPSP